MKVSELVSMINLPDLIATHCGAKAITGLHREHGGAICDPRPGHSEKNPSFSVFKVVDGWLWKRHGEDGASGNAYGFLLELGFTKKQAIEELHQLAGVTVGGWHSRSLKSRVAVLPPSALTQAKHALTRCTPLTFIDRQRAEWILAPLANMDGAAQDLRARGLYGWGGLDAYKLRRPIKTRDGRTLAHSGALAFMLAGPAAQANGLKVRNLGTKAELAAAGLDRYVYGLPGHGAPAWCSPGYGRGEALLIVEGELNGAAAFRAGRFVGLSLDVQGLAGASGVPYLEGMTGRVVYLHFDSDEAGVAGLARVGQIAREAGAAEVKVLSSYQDGDFCDELGEIGVFKFGCQLRHRLESAQNLPSDLGPHPDLRPIVVPETMLSGTVPSIWGQQNIPSRGIWGRKRGLQ